MKSSTNPQSRFRKAKTPTPGRHYVSWQSLMLLSVLWETFFCLISSSSKGWLLWLGIPPLSPSWPGSIIFFVLVFYPMLLWLSLLLQVLKNSSQERAIRRKICSCSIPTNFMDSPSQTMTSVTRMGSHELGCRFYPQRRVLTLAKKKSRRS